MAYSVPTFLFRDTLTASAMSSVSSAFQAFADDETDSPFMNSRHFAIVNYSESTINFSENISSVSDNGVGNFRINFSFTASTFVVSSKTVISYSQHHFAHQTTNGNATVVYGVSPYDSNTTYVDVYHHFFNSSGHGYYDPQNATAIFFNTDVSTA